MWRLALLLTLCCGIHAQSKTERELLDLRIRTSKLEAAKEAAERERDRMAEQIAQAGRTATANRKVASANADKGATATQESAAVQVAVTQDQLEIITRAAEDAKAASETAQAQADRIVASGSSQFYIQLFIFLTVISGYGYQAYKTHAETKEVVRKEGVAEQFRKDARAALAGIHKLGNSTVTELKGRELRALRANLGLLLATATSSDQDIAKNARTLAEVTRTEIAVLEVELAERARQEKEAADKVRADLAQMPGAKE